MAAVEWPELTEAEMAAVAPLLKGRPHMYAHMPTRFVTKEEAKARRWTYFYIGDVCKQGHKAPRFVSNPSDCVDCNRIRQGMETIGGKGSVESVAKMYKVKSEKPDGKSDRPLEPTRRQKEFLARYAELKDFDLAAAKVNVSSAVLESELAYDVIFRNALDQLEERIGVYHSAAYDVDFEWDESKRAALIRTYINTGDLGTARDSIRCTPAQFYDECKENPQFAAQVEEAKVYADKIVEERVRRGAIEGNPQLLIGVAKQLKLDEPTDPGGGRTREQLIDEIARTLGLAKLGSAAPAANVHEHDPAPATGAADAAVLSEGESESYSDLL